MAADLTPSQSKVVDFPYLPNSTLKVVAGPGSGKTLTLLHKVYHLIESGEIAPNEILILSLTNKAVDNVITRLFDVFEQLNEKHTEEQLREIIGDLEVHTVHGLANRVVIENEGIINIIEENGWRGLMKLVSEDFWKNKRPRMPSTKDFKKLFEQYKNQKTGTKDVVKKLTDIMQNCGVVTNEELIDRASRYLSSDLVSESETMQYTRELKGKIKVVIIDEFQDLYPSLLPLLRRISLGKQLILFGDSNQSIYSFLGSNKEAMRAIEGIHTGQDFHVMHLHDNFRCTPEIMAAATQVIPAKRKEMKDGEIEKVCKDKCGVKPIMENFSNPLDELEFVRDQISQLVCASARLSDIAILTRTNNQMQLIADHLQSYGINSHKLTAQPDWMTDTRIQFLIDLMKVISLSHREESLERKNSMNRPWKSDFSLIVTLGALKGATNQSIQILYNECLRRDTSLWRYISSVPVSDWPTAVTNKRKISNCAIELQKLMNNGEFLYSDDPMHILREICSFAHEMGFQMLQPTSDGDAEQFRQHLEDMYTILKLCLTNRPNDMPLIEWFLHSHFEQSLSYYHQNPVPRAGSRDVLKISTIHSSKGLEFPIVFLMGGLSWFQTFSQFEDNVLYVGMTRAKNLLYLLNTKHPGLDCEPTKRNIMANEKFWRYYNTDLNRATAADSMSAIRRYDCLQRKYGGFSINHRPFSTLSVARNNKLIKLVAYIARK
ncbi:hypothetical protein HG536_0G02020 [Torulaspora globosa]|uniref:DNA 3'-5' helicase n=1 Tax=Torulaspora globosa TaxID=48254 RepID=A0A7G3ZLF7_9SACH|nr:uncharacterized protein HG536_0G02020 [Torulaspora globosa]QLL34343.1 hypothetical protein HG536_0G02020 [Torulaspora globosa]